MLYQHETCAQVHEEGEIKHEYNLLMVQGGVLVAAKVLDLGTLFASYHEPHVTTVLQGTALSLLSGSDEILLVVGKVLLKSNDSELLLVALTGDHELSVEEGATLALPTRVLVVEHSQGDLKDTS